MRLTDQARWGEGWAVCSSGAAAIGPQSAIVMRGHWATQEWGLATAQHGAQQDGPFWSISASARVRRPAHCSMFGLGSFSKRQPDVWRLQLGFRWAGALGLFTQAGRGVLATHI